MWRISIFAILLVMVHGLTSEVRAQGSIVPAGTLVRCVLDEPRLSPTTADVGDPILCRLNNARVGSVVFPRGSYLAGHVEAEKRLGSFGTHGYIKLMFDHVAAGDMALPVTGKIIAVQNHEVDHEGKIIGGWLADPVLKSETTVTVKLLDDVEMPNVRVRIGPGWHFFDESRY